MAEADTVGRYPQSTPGGEPIPFEIIRPLGLIKKSFSDVAASNVALPDGADFLVLRATEDCLIQFTIDTAAALPADGVHVAGLLFLGVGEVQVIDHNAATEFSVIRAGADSGILYIQTCSKYADIRKSAQLERT